MDGPSFILTTLPPEIFNDFTIQKPFIAQMSSSLSNAISRTGLDPLKTPLGRWQYGMGASQCGEGGGGARGLDSILTFPSVNTSASALTRIKRKRKKSVKKKKTKRKGAGKRKKAPVAKRGGRRRKGKRKRKRKKVARKRPAQARAAGRKRRAGKKKSSTGGSRKRKRKALAIGGGKRRKKARASAGKKKKKTTTTRRRKRKGRVGAPRNQPNFSSSSERFIF